MTRRQAAGLLSILLPSLLRAQEASEIIAAVTPLAAALSAGDADDFLSHIASSTPDRQRLSDNVKGLVAQAEITSSVKLASLTNGRAQLDWHMDIRTRLRQLMIERRKGTVTVTIQDGLVTLIEPVDFFKPAEIR